MRFWISVVVVVFGAGYFWTQWLEPLAYETFQCIEGA